MWDQERNDSRRHDMMPAQQRLSGKKLNCQQEHENRWQEGWCNTMKSEKKQIPDIYWKKKQTEERKMCRDSVEKEENQTKRSLWQNWRKNTGKNKCRPTCAETLKSLSDEKQLKDVKNPNIIKNITWRRSPPLLLLQPQAQLQSAGVVAIMEDI